jgi:hypothetical protein
MASTVCSPQWSSESGGVQRDWLSTFTCLAFAIPSGHQVTYYRRRLLCGSPPSVIKQQWYMYASTTHIIMPWTPNFLIINEVEIIWVPLVISNHQATNSLSSNSSVKPESDTNTVWLHMYTYLGSDTFQGTMQTFPLQTQYKWSVSEVLEQVVEPVVAHIITEDKDSVTVLWPTYDSQTTI